MAVWIIFLSLLSLVTAESRLESQYELNSTVTYEELFRILINFPWIPLPGITLPPTAAPPVPPVACGTTIVPLSGPSPCSCVNAAGTTVDTCTVGQLCEAAGCLAQCVEAPTTVRCACGLADMLACLPATTCTEGTPYSCL